MKNFNKKTSNFFYDLLTEEMENICNVQNDADVIGLKIRNAIKTTNRTTPYIDILPPLKAVGFLGNFYCKISNNLFVIFGTFIFSYVPSSFNHIKHLSTIFKPNCINPS